MLQFRKLLKMATETAAKKLKTEGPLIGTHKYVCFRIDGNLIPHSFRKCHEIVVPRTHS